MQDPRISLPQETIPKLQFQDDQCPNCDTPRTLLKEISNHFKEHPHTCVSQNRFTQSSPRRKEDLSWFSFASWRALRDKLLILFKAIPQAVSKFKLVLRLRTTPAPGDKES
jgi:hypothetical protein